MTRNLLLLSLLAFACGDDDIAPVDAGIDASADAADSSVEEDTGDERPDYPRQEVESERREDGVRIDVVQVDVPAPDANPVTGATTPDELSRIQVVRYRRDGDAISETRAVMIAMPGFLAGAASLDGLARGIVAEATDPLEVWVVDRRGNELEDLRGMNTAEAAGDAEIAFQYYAYRATLDGDLFEGFLPPSELSFMSEWGLASLVSDVHAIIGLVPEDERKERVFLLGHSLGASFTEAYAAWRFEDGSRGSDELAGIVLVDGVLGGESVSEEDFRDGFMRGGFPSAGLDGIRESAPNVTLPFLGIDIYVQAEVLALRAAIDPTGVVEDRARDMSLSLLLGYPPANVPPMTNAAAFALPFDESSGALSFARLGVGAPDAETETFTSLLGDELTRPVGSEEPIGWIDGPESGEASTVAEFTRSFTAGPTNYAQWYFPARLPLDLAAVGGAAVDEEGWQAGEGLRAFDGPLMDAPVLAVACALVGSPGAYDAVRERVAPTIGEGRAMTGASRADEGAFVVVDAVSLQHLDPGVAAEGSRNVTIPETISFVERHAAEGTLSLP